MFNIGRFTTSTWAFEPGGFGGQRAHQVLWGRKPPVVVGLMYRYAAVIISYPQKVSNISNDISILRLCICIYRDIDPPHFCSFSVLVLTLFYLLRAPNSILTRIKAIEVLILVRLVEGQIAWPNLARRQVTDYEKLNTSTDLWALWRMLWSLRTVRNMTCGTCSWPQSAYRGGKKTWPWRERLDRLIVSNY